MQGITLATKIADLLNDYDGMKDILIGINPKFKKLNNPVLRRTLGRIASVQQAAIVGGMDPKDLVDQLRMAVGQEPICIDCEIKSEACEMPSLEVQAPDWIELPVAHLLDANQLLDKNKNPLAEVRKILHHLGENELLILESDFIPEPLIDEFKKDGFVCHTTENNNNKYITYIKGNIGK